MEDKMNCDAKSDEKSRSPAKETVYMSEKEQDASEESLRSQFAKGISLQSEGRSNAARGTDAMSSPTDSTEEEERFMRNTREDRNKASKNPKIMLSTTSSVYAEHTISNPDNDQVNYCIAAILQAQIFDDTQNPELDNPLREFFEIQLTLPEEYGGIVEVIPEAILNHESMNDNELRDKLVAGEVPTVDTIYRFISMMIGLAEFSVECNILSLVYLNRITGRNKIAMTMKNFRGLWIAGIVLAQKVWDDQPLKTSSFTRILPGATKEQLKQLEMKAFELLEYNTTVKPSVYAKYYFELRHLFKELVGNNPRYQWKAEPLSIAEGKRLSHRSTQRGTQKTKSESKNGGDRGERSTNGGGASNGTAGSKASSTMDSKDLESLVMRTPKALEDIEILKSPSRYVLS